MSSPQTKLFVYCTYSILLRQTSQDMVIFSIGQSGFSGPSDQWCSLAVMENESILLQTCHVVPLLVPLGVQYVCGEHNPIFIYFFTCILLRPWIYVQLILLVTHCLPEEHIKYLMCGSVNLCLHAGLCIQLLVHNDIMLPKQLIIILIHFHYGVHFEANYLLENDILDEPVFDIEFSVSVHSCTLNTRLISSCLIRPFSSTLLPANWLMSSGYFHSPPTGVGQTHK